MKTNEMLEEIKSYVQSRLSRLDYDCLQKLEEMVLLEKSTRPEEMYF